MAAPNLLDTQSVIGKSPTPVLLTTTDPTVIVNNPASSGKVLKVNLLRCINVHTSVVNITVKKHPEDDGGGTGREILPAAFDIPIGAAIDVLSKDSSIYLEEDQSLVATAGSANHIVVATAYEEIS